MVLEEEDLTKETLTSTVYKLFEKRGSYVDAMRNSNQQDSIDTIISMITQASNKCFQKQYIIPSVYQTFILTLI